MKPELKLLIMDHLSVREGLFDEGSIRKRFSSSKEISLLFLHRTILDLISYHN